MASQATVVTTLEIGEATDIGRGSGKERNEDSCAFFEVRLLSNESDGLQPGTVAVVADGMGGMVGGAEASQTALATMRQFMASPSNPSLSLSEWMATAIHEANATINQRAESSRELEGMGTTLVSVLATGDELYLAHVGDSRAYLLRNGELRQLNRDHTWVQDALDRGRLSHEEARTHPNRHVLKRHLGTDLRLEVDQRIVDPTLPDEPPTFVSSIPLMAGDTILLCTDGLSDPVEAEAIRDALGRGTAQQSATELVRLANEAGGRDNITALVMRVPGGKFLPMRRVPKALPVLPLVLGALLVVLLGGGAMMMRGGATDSPGGSLAGVVLGTGGSTSSEGDGSGASAARGLQLPTAGPGDPGFVTSTAAPGQPTSTPHPTSTPAPPAAPGAPPSSGGSAPPAAPGSMARGVTLLQPGAGATISQQSPGFSAQVSGLQAGDSVAVLVGPTQNLNTSHRVGVMQPSGDRHMYTARSLTAGNYWWTVVIYNAQNREEARATARSFSVTGGAVPAPSATPRPSAPTATRPPASTVAPTRPPAATTAPSTNTPVAPTQVPPTQVPPTPVPPTNVPPTNVPPTNVPPATNTPVPPPTATDVPPPTATDVPPP